MYDAMTFSENQYYGTARTMGLGNAVTAVGGDLGTVGINPAGSAVSYFGQFTVTPGFNVSSVKASADMGGPYHNKSTRMNLPNVGMSMIFPTGNHSGLKNVTFSFVVNQTANYNRRPYASWRNGSNSKLAEFAYAAGHGNNGMGYDESVLSNYDSFKNSDVPWDILTAYQSGMFGSYEQGGYCDYVGNTEKISPDGSYHYVPAELQQTSSINRWGQKSDILINMGFNFDDRLYLGFNIGTPTMTYRYSEVFSETPVNFEQFPISFQTGDTYFKGATYDYQYTASASGLYGKVGVIWLPVKGIRLGAAVQSPTMMNIREAWDYGGLTDFSDSRFNGDVVSPEGNYRYGLRTPYIVNLGAAFTFGKVGFLSVDYEMADYHIMKFRTYYSSRRTLTDDSTFYNVNTTTRNFCGLAHQLRIGGEIRIVPAFSLRLGYGLSTSPERHWTDSKGNDVTANDYMQSLQERGGTSIQLVKPYYYGDLTHSFSLGVGYSSQGPFFADFAVRLTDYPDWKFSPYYDYYGYTSAGEYLEQKAPRVNNHMTLIDAALTFGWRF